MPRFQTTSHRVATRRPNRYGGRCDRCGDPVSVGSGYIERSDRGWLVFHLDQCPQRSTLAPSYEQLPSSAAASMFERALEVPPGHYAVPSASNNDLDFYRVDRPTEGRWSGYTFVKRVIGGRPNVQVRGSAARDALTRIVENGISLSAVTYGREIGRCYVCNRTLTDETSRQLGIGPDCRREARAELRFTLHRVAADEAEYRTSRLTSSAMRESVGSQVQPQETMKSELGTGEVL